MRATSRPMSDPYTLGEPFGLMEYYAPCYANGSLAILFFGISRNGRNILASPNHSASMAIQSPPDRSLANKPRVSLLGTMKIFPRHYEGGPELQQCYKRSHPDAWWVPRDKPGVHDVRMWAHLELSRRMTGSFFLIRLCGLGSIHM
jgi:hypothetical protein